MSNPLSGILLNDNLFSQADKFDLLKKINRDSKNFRDNAILVAMRLKEDGWGDYAEIASSLVRKSGLFLYLDDDTSDYKDMLTKQIYKSPSGRNYFMHRAQYEVLDKLLAGESVILSAPTSFGKSFVIDELLLSGNYDNVLIVVPTIALIDETRRRIDKLGLAHKVVCFTSQVPEEKNVFILTQERALEMQSKINSLDLLIIDEFYKMDSSIGNDDGERADLLNVCYRIYEAKATQTYLLGPYIQNVAGYINTKREPKVIVCDDNTTFIEYIHVSGKREEAVQKIIKDEKTNILIYCNSPQEIAKLYRQIETAQCDYGSEKLNLDFAEWINKNVCPGWYVTEALKLGIGVHHARMPRFVAQEMIKRFNAGQIKVLLCTSTIIEGVNTSAKTVIVYSQKRGTGRLDGFTFKNIAGRAGRMLRHFSGKVYYFKKPDSTDDIVVTDNIGSDQDGIEANMLSLLDETQLTQKQASKVEAHTLFSNLPSVILKDNYFIPVELQETVYSNLQSGKYPLLVGIRSSHPSQAEIKDIFHALSDLGVNFRSIGRAKTEENGIIRTSIFINAFLSKGVMGVATAVNPDRKLSDDSIEFAFEFIRNQISFKLPKYIKALDRLLQYSLLGNGTLEPFIGTLEFLNQPASYIQLDELGLPVQISAKLGLSKENVELAIKQAQSGRSLGHLNEFEQQVVHDFMND